MTPAMLREKIAETIGFDKPKVVESLGIVGLSLPAYRFEAIMDAIMAEVAAYTAKAVEASTAGQAIQVERCGCQTKICKMHREGWISDNQGVTPEHLRSHTAGSPP